MLIIQAHPISLVEEPFISSLSTNPLLLLLLLLGFESPPLSRASLYRHEKRSLVKKISLSLSFPLLSLPILPMPTWDYRSDHRARCDCTVLVFQRASFSPRGGLKRSEQEFARVPVCEKSIGPCNDLSSPSSFSHLLPNSRPDGAPGFSSHTLSNVQRERERGETFVREWFNSRELCSR